MVELRFRGAGTSPLCSVSLLSRWTRCLRYYCTVIIHTVAYISVLYSYELVAKVSIASSLMLTEIPPLATANTVLKVDMNVSFSVATWCCSQ